jgi:hypothetical protein
MILFPTIYLVFWALSTGLLVLVGVLPRLGVDYRFHMLGGLAAAFVACLLHTAVMIHLVGTGRSIKEALPYAPAPRRDYVPEQTRIKTASYPVSTLCCVLACATAILGGARNFGAVSAGVHMGFAVALLAASVFALPWQYRLLRKNGVLLGEVEAELETVVLELEAAGKLPPVMPWQV